MFNQGSSSARGNIFSPIAQTHQLPIQNQTHNQGFQNTVPLQNQFQQQQQQLQQLQQLQQQQYQQQPQPQQQQQPQFPQNIIQNNYTHQQQDQQQQQQQQQLLLQQQQNQQWNNQHQYPQQQAYQNQGFQFVQPAQDYTNPDAIPQKIDLKFYGIEEKIEYIKSLLFLRFLNGQILYHHNITQRAFSETQAKIIIKNFREFQELVHDKVYQIQTEEGFWLILVSDVDRVYMCFFHLNFSLDWAYTVLNNFMQTLNDKELFRINSGTEIQVQIQVKLQNLCNQIEMELLQQREPILKVEKTKVDFQQNQFTIGISEPTMIAQVSLISEKKNVQQINPAFQASNLWKDFKANFQSIISICICILLVIVVIVLIYKFILQDIILSVQSNQQQNQIKQHLFMKIQHSFRKQQ